MIRYEAVLASTSGWSNPIRHLGRLPLFDDRSTSEEVTGGPARQRANESPTVTRVEISARYNLRVRDDDALLAFASGRFGNDVQDVKEAVKVLFEAESWDPDRYPPGLLDVEDVSAEISVVPPG